MPEKPKSWLGLDPLFGQAGAKGFSSTASILEQRSNDIFDHNNVIKRDVVTTQWMPYLNSNVRATHDELEKYFRRSK